MTLKIATESNRRKSTDVKKQVEFSRSLSTNLENENRDNKFSCPTSRIKSNFRNITFQDDSKNLPLTDVYNL